MKNNLLVIGSTAFDSIETPFGKANKILGGSASYFSFASSRFTPTSVVAVVGEDFNQFDKFKKLGVDTSGIIKAKGKTFYWAGKYNFDLSGRETLKTELGVFANFQPHLSPAQQQSKYIFLSNAHPKLQLDVLEQIKKPKFAGLDTMNYWIKSAPDDLEKVLRKVDVLIINDSEARELSGEHNLLKAAKKILGMMSPTTLHSHPSTLVIKRGEHGLFMFQPPVPLRVHPKQSNKRLPRYARNDNLLLFSLPGYPLEHVIDPTGAGDTFAGGFFGYIAKTDDISWTNLKRACITGSVMASFCVEKMGTKKLLDIKISDINKRLKDFETLRKL